MAWHALFCYARLPTHGLLMKTLKTKAPCNCWVKKEYPLHGMCQKMAPFTNVSRQQILREIKFTLEKHREISLTGTTNIKRRSKIDTRKTTSHCLNMFEKWRTNTTTIHYRMVNSKTSFILFKHHEKKSCCVFKRNSKLSNTLIQKHYWINAWN